MSALLWIGFISAAAAAYFNVDKGGVRFGSLAMIAVICFVAGIASMPKRNSYGVDCTRFSSFAYSC